MSATKRVPFSKRHVTEPRWARDIPTPSEMIKNIFVYGNKEVAWFKKKSYKQLYNKRKTSLKKLNMLK